MTFSPWTVRALLVVPIGAYIFTFVLPLLFTARMSANDFSRLTGIQDDVQLGNYGEIATDSYFLDAWLTTMRISAVVAVITVLLGAAVAYLLWTRGGRLRAVMTVVILLPLFVSGVVRAYGWIPVTGPTGVLPRVTEALGLGSWSIMFSESAVVLGLTHIMLPYAVLIILSSLDSVSRSVISAADNLGATRAQTLRRVVIPLMRPALTSSALLIFAVSSAAYAIPAILGGRRINVISLVIFQSQTATRNWPLASALAVTLVVLTILVMVAANRNSRRSAVKAGASV